MRKLIWIVAIFAALYGGYWFVGSRAALTGMEAALDRMKAEGLGTYRAVTLRGFPSRFDITIDKPELVSGTGARAGRRISCNCWRCPIGPIR